MYTLNNSSFDVYIGAFFGIIGYVFYKLGCEPAPLLLGFILGPMMEENLRRALLLSRGDWSTFVTRPLSAGLLLAALAMVVRGGAAVDQGQTPKRPSRKPTDRPPRSSLAGAASGRSRRTSRGPSALVLGAA